LVDHNEKGSIGFILNKPLEMSLGDTELKIEGDEFHMHFGGPVQSTDLFYIHNKGAQIEGSTEVKDGLHWGGDFKIIEAMIKDGTMTANDIRFFVGYSGWDSDQLANEIKEDSWLVHETDLTYLFHTKSENLWKNILRELDSAISILSTFPEDPNLN
jgi:putative transcriptional regulator